MIIKQLPPLEAQKIAAGEVVERPSNIVKELIENALDAGATKIVLALEEGGKRLISVTDNGIGMVPEDARISFLRHTTSKLTQFDDLQAIATFGFRGEALASMCSVARITIATRHASSEAGITLGVEEGSIVKETVSAGAIGTTITVEDLFYNIPARQKFLKSTTTELNQITQLFKAFCLGRIDVHFVMTHNKGTVYNCPPVTTLISRVAQLFDTSVSKQLLPCSDTKDALLQGVGIMTGPGYGRYDRSGIYVFVNHRWVKNYPLVQAMIKGYGNVLQPGKYPLVVLNLTVDSREVDPNVHPKKEEVALLHTRTVETFITQLVKKTLEQNVSVTLGFAEPYVAPLRTAWSAPSSLHTASMPSENLTIKKSVLQVRDLYFDPTVTAQSQHEAMIDDAVHKNNFSDESVTAIETVQEFAPIQLAAPFAQEVADEAPLTSLTFLGQLHATYLMLEHPEGLLLVDQHAAHERVIYQRIAMSFAAAETVTLLFPELVTCLPDDMATVLDYLDLLQAHGIICEQYSENQLVVRSKSVYAQSINVEELVRQILGWVQDFGRAERSDIQKYVTEKLRAQIACKAAIKAGDPMTQEKAWSLLKDLESVEHRFSCPHGRPTMWVLPKLDIEKRFKRRL